MQSLLDLLFVGGFDSSLTVGLRPVGDAVRARSGVRRSRLPAPRPGVGGAERGERAGSRRAGAGGLQTFSPVGNTEALDKAGVQNVIIRTVPYPL